MKGMERKTVKDENTNKSVIPKPAFIPQSQNIIKNKFLMYSNKKENYKLVITKIYDSGQCDAFMVGSDNTIGIVDVNINGIETSNDFIEIEGLNLNTNKRGNKNE